jgi:hypothetical protein
MSISRTKNNAAHKQPAPDTRATAPLLTPRPNTRRPRVVGANPWHHAPELAAAPS